MNVKPRSPLTALREAMTSLRRLLDGEEVSLDGDYFKLDRVRLTRTGSKNATSSAG